MKKSEVSAYQKNEQARQESLERAARAASPDSATPVVDQQTIVRRKHQEYLERQNRMVDLLETRLEPMLDHPEDILGVVAEISQKIDHYAKTEGVSAAFGRIFDMIDNLDFKLSIGEQAKIVRTLVQTRGELIASGRIAWELNGTSGETDKITQYAAAAAAAWRARGDEAEETPAEGKPE